MHTCINALGLNIKHASHRIHEKDAYISVQVDLINESLRIIVVTLSLCGDLQYTTVLFACTKGV